MVTGFPAGMLACNCYLLAQRAGPDAIVILERPIQQANDRSGRALERALRAGGPPANEARNS